jgi:hypothetical protein
MKTSSCIVIFSCLCSALFLGACGIESQESTFKYRLQTLDELAAKVPADMKAAIAAEKARFEEAYKKLPAEEGPRGEGLGKLNQDSRAFIDVTQKKIDEIAAAGDAKRQASDKAEFSARLNSLAGDWQGTGMRLIITPDGTVEYERLAGGAKKSITGGTVTRIGTDSFEVKVLVGSTTFRIDGLPRKEGAAWKMKVDGVEVVKR